MNEKKVEALRLQVGEKVRELRLIIKDSNVPEEDREKAKKKLARYRTLLHEQAAAANGNGSKHGLQKA